MARFTANNGSAWIKDQQQLEDIKLLIRYKAGERDFCNLNLHNWMLEKIGKTYLNYNKPADFRNETLTGINLSGSDLNNAELENTNLAYANLRGVNLDNAKLEGAILSGANLEGAILSNANLKNANLCGVDLTNTIVLGANFKGVIIDENTKLDDKNKLIWEIVNQGAVDRNLSGVDLTEANLQSVNLERANLKQAKLYKANLTNSILDGVDLTEADLQQARLINTKFRKANLYHAVLYESKLECSNWRKADLRKTNFDKTSLNSASSLQEAYYDEETIFPEGFDPEYKKMVYVNVTKDYKYVEFVKKLSTLEKIKKQKSPPPRPGQEEFKKALIEIYGAKCIITGCNIEEVIEAAHIIPYRNQDSHNIANGLLLRVDLHRLFDKYLLTIHPETRRVLIAPELMDGYKDILGKTIETRLSGEDAINHKYVLDAHYQKFRFTKTISIDI
ncbi:MAG: pentapeptide repeat-containing protein [Nostoc sp. ChiSLP02]|nr:pentapeptide repeat-containing protein [Nostoc sp. DedSLP05]MDZ8103807.1 pentapeptide repeat-containing protein [Nostoc sp. DedSLP01]MDZ8184383.1 pentapeptide repeat-containing protein [Nostoc sp. ChiSLP02]